MRRRPPDRAPPSTASAVAASLRQLYGSQWVFSFLAALASYRVHRGLGLAALLWAALIGVSTLFTKQHYVVDVAAGALLAYAPSVPSVPVVQSRCRSPLASAEARYILIG